MRRTCPSGCPWSLIVKIEEKHNLAGQDANLKKVEKRRNKAHWLLINPIQIKAKLFLSIISIAM
jgi:hypothetical protein